MVGVFVFCIRSLYIEFVFCVLYFEFVVVFAFKLQLRIKAGRIVMVCVPFGSAQPPPEQHHYHLHPNHNCQNN